MREVLLYSTFLIVVFGAMFGYLYATSEVIQVQVTGKRIQQTTWRPCVGTGEYVIQSKKNGYLGLPTPHLRGYCWAGAEAFKRLRSGCCIRLSIVNCPFSQRPGTVAVIQVID